MSDTSKTPAVKRELDNCEICGGHRGGVRGNENRIEEIVVCDYCTVRTPPLPSGLVSAKTVALYSFALTEQLTFLMKKLNQSNEEFGTPGEIIGRMHTLLAELRQLPLAAEGQPWFPVLEQLPDRYIPVLVGTRDGLVKESNGSSVRELANAALRDDEDCYFTYWTPMPAHPQPPVDEDEE
jgi:hypothetical protein